MKVIQDLNISEKPIIQGHKLKSVYVMSTESAFEDKTQRNETSELWHMRLGHVIKLSLMMKKSILNGLPQIALRTNIVCTGCQYDKAHQLRYEDSKFKVKDHWSWYI